MSKFLNFIALAGFLAVTTLTSGPVAVNALAVESVHGANVVRRDHAGIAKRTRSSHSKRCKPRNPVPAAAAPAAESSKTSEESKPDSGNSGNSGESTSDNNNNNNTPKPDTSAPNTVDVGEFSQLGFAWTMSGDLLPSYKQSKTALIYNWGSSGPDVEGFEFMPMAWGDKNVDQFKKDTAKKQPKFALGPNEPELINDTGLSSGMSTDSVVALYWDALHPLAQKGTKILTPAVTSGQKGFDWMTEFMGKCSTCNFAGQALHWYDVEYKAAIEHFKKHHSAFGLPIYCTEIAFQNFNGGAQLSLGDAFYQMGEFNKWVKSAEGADIMKVVMYFGYQDDMTNVSPTLQLIDTASKMPNALGSAVIDALRQ